MVYNVLSKTLIWHLLIEKAFCIMVIGQLFVWLNSLAFDFAIFELGHSAHEIYEAAISREICLVVPNDVYKIVININTSNDIVITWLIIWTFNSTTHSHDNTDLHQHVRILHASNWNSKFKRHCNYWCRSVTNTSHISPACASFGVSDVNILESDCL